MSPTTAFKMEVNKKLFARLLDDSIPVREYNAIYAIFEKKIKEIWEYIAEKSKRQIGWMEYAFDPNDDFIQIEGATTWVMDHHYPFNEGFPTDFLWSDYQQKVDIAIEKCQAKSQARKNQQTTLKKQDKEQKNKLIESIKQKLSPEELKIVKFK